MNEEILYSKAYSIFLAEDARRYRSINYSNFKTILSKPETVVSKKAIFQNARKELLKDKINDILNT